MYRWCAYCQHYVGEKPPFDNYDLTHGICAECLSRDTMSDDEAVARTRPIAEFHAELLARAHAGHIGQVNPLVQRGLALGMRPVDLLVGILQPALYEIGRRWEAGSLTPAQEHVFTEFCDAVLEQLSVEQGRLVPPSSQPPILLINAAGNLHTIGLRMAVFTLREEGRNALALIPTPSLENLAVVIAQLRPSIVGVSISIPSQVDFLRDLLALVASFEPRPRVIAGGYAVRAGLVLPPGVEAWMHPGPLPE
jgi:methanogenic corrinoid protein MtbC1